MQDTVGQQVVDRDGAGGGRGGWCRVERVVERPER